MALTESVVSTLQNVRGQDYVDTLANKFLLKPKVARGIGGFVFDYEGETEVHHQAEITDHYAEDNKVINDHIAIRPVRLTLHGYVGELVAKAPFGITGLLNTLQNKLGSLPGLLGKYTPQAVNTLSKAVTKAQNTVNLINTTIGKIQNIVGLFINIAPGETAQQHAYSWLYALYITKQVFTVDTPYTYFDNMVIESLTFIQDETTKFWSDICVVLKQIRLVNVPVVTDKNANRNVLAGTTNQGGKTPGTQQPVSVLKNLLKTVHMVN